MVKDFGKKKESKTSAGGLEAEGLKKRWNLCQFLLLFFYIPIFGNAFWSEVCKEKKKTVKKKKKMIIKDPLLTEILRWGGGVRSLAAGFTRPTTPSSDSPLYCNFSHILSARWGVEWYLFPPLPNETKEFFFFNILIINLFFFATIWHKKKKKNCKNFNIFSSWKYKNMIYSQYIINI